MDIIKDTVLNFLRRPESLLWTGGVMVFLGIVAIIGLVVQPSDVPATVLPTVAPTRAYPTPHITTFTPAPPTVQPSPAILLVTHTPLPTPTRGMATAHVVAAGDTLLGLALEYDVTVEAIKIANAMTEDLVYEGAELIIPVPATVPTITSLASGTGTLHVVAEGETLGGIALEYDVTTEALLAVNNLASDDFIYVGQELVIPNE